MCFVDHGNFTMSPSDLLLLYETNCFNKLVSSTNKCAIALHSWTCDPSLQLKPHFHAKLLSNFFRFQPKVYYSTRIQTAWHFWDGFQQRDKPILFDAMVGLNQHSFNERENYIKLTYPWYLYEGHNILFKLLSGPCLTCLQTLDFVL